MKLEGLINMTEDDGWIKSVLVASGTVILGKLFLDALKPRCPRCNYPVDKTNSYCPNCYQPLDWRGK